MKRPRHQPTKMELLDRLPRAFRPKLTHHQVKTLGLVHLVNLDAIARGEADVEILWQVVGGMLTWSFVATALQAGEPEMRIQLDLAYSLIERYDRTGRVGFSGTEYQLAKAGIDQMDALAEIVDQATASKAADQSQALIDQMQSERLQRVAA